MKIVFYLAILLICNLVFSAVPEDENERLLGSLIAQGVICESLNYGQQQKALAIYLQRKQRNNSMNRPNNLKHYVYPNAEDANGNVTNDLHVEILHSELTNSNEKKACLRPPELPPIENINKE